MNRHDKLEIIAKIQQLPPDEQGTVACLFEAVERIDSATKLPYVIGPWAGLAGLVLFSALTDLSGADSVMSYLLGIIVATGGFLAGVWTAKLLYFNRMRAEAITFLGYASIDEGSRLAMIKLKELDPAAKMLVEQYQRVKH
ncbi:hypothetical protein KJ611_01160 [Patescibacteria group bacterium]|nr:hypothetical protein [Patescibacteria group bacterium]